MIHPSADIFANAQEIILPDDFLARRPHYLPIAKLRAVEAIDFSEITTDGRNVSWLYHPAIMSSVIFQAYLYGGNTRKRGGQLSSVHQLRIAHNMANERDLIGEYSAVFLAFVALHHDTVEDGRKEGFNAIRALACALSYLAPYSNQVAEAEQIIWSVTDNGKLKGAARTAAQAESIGQYPKVIQYLRVYDKLEQLQGDCAFYRECLKFTDKGFIPEDELQKLAFQIEFDLDKAIERADIVKAAVLVRPELKEKYTKSLKALAKLYNEIYIRADQPERPGSNSAEARAKASRRLGLLTTAEVRLRLG